MRKMAAFALTLILAFLALPVISCRQFLPHARTIIVPDEYPTIQQAVNAAVSGDTVQVKHGVYTENVLIESKSISLIGEDSSNTIIRGVSEAG